MTHRTSEAIPLVTPRVAERFWAKVQRLGDDACWLWTGGTGQQRQPVMMIERRNISGRRVAWELQRGEVLPKNRHVTVTCGTPDCVNAAHLRLREHMDLPARFWGKVEKTDGCWNWKGRLVYGGYGGFTVASRPERAHRIAYQITHGPLTPDQIIMHTCDNRACVRPDHLRIGSHQENMDDMNAKGRGSSGDRHRKSMVDGKAARVALRARYDALTEAAQVVEGTPFADRILALRPEVSQYRGDL